MKNIRMVAFTILMLGAFSCTNQQKSSSNDASGKPTGVEGTTSDQIEVKAYGALVKEILTTSPRYLKLTKGLLAAVVANGGTSYGVTLEGSPNPQQDSAWAYSRNYDFTLYEMYPDRKLTTASFTFDPHKLKLYEFDKELAQKRSIEFDNRLLLKFHSPKR